MSCFRHVFAHVGAVVVSVAASGCVIDRSGIGASDAGQPTSPDAFALDAPGLDALGVDALGLDALGLDAAPSEIDAAGTNDDAFVIEGTDAWAPVGDDAWSPPTPDAPPVCVPLPETCNARDDNCDGQFDESGCGGSVGVLSVACVSFVHADHVYQVCKATGFGVPWEVARMACRNNPPYDLVRIDDNSENAAISSHVLETRAWIGLNDQVTEGTFVWSDGSVLGSYDSWAGGEPRGGAMGRLENCVTLAARSPVWRDEACGVLDVSVGTDVAVFVCEAPVVR